MTAQNVTQAAYIVAALLFILASGPVKGFGITLTIGVIASMFSALVVARWLTEWLVKRKWVRTHPQASGIGGISSLRHWLNEHGPYLVRRAGLTVQNRASRGEPLATHHGFVISPSDDAAIRELVEQLRALGRVEQTLWLGVLE